MLRKQLLLLPPSERLSARGRCRSDEGSSDWRNVSK